MGWESINTFVGNLYEGGVAGGSRHDDWLDFIFHEWHRNSKMIIKRQYRLYPKNDSLFQKLQEIGIASSEVAFSNFFYVTEGSDEFEKVLPLIEEVQNDGHTEVHLQYFLEYSEQELQNAPWLHIRSNYAGITPTNASQIYEYRCPIELNDEGKTKVLYEHTIQVKDVEIRRGPKWRAARQFCSDYHSAMIALYCSNAARNVIEDNHLSGAGFRSVLKDKTQKEFPDIWQIWPHESCNFLIAGPYEETRICRVCGEKRYCSSDGRAQLYVDQSRIPHDYDFLQSPPVYGTNTGFPYYVISQRAYRVLKDANITKDLVFIPLHNV